MTRFLPYPTPHLSPFSLLIRRWWVKIPRQRKTSHQNNYKKINRRKIVSFNSQNIARDGEFSTIVDLLDSEDRDLVYAAVGILVNLMSDPLQRPLFK